MLLFFKKARGPFVFTLIALLIVNYVIELNFGFIHSLNKAVDEVEMSDIYYSKIQNNLGRVESRIVIVDIDTIRDRGDIARLLKKIDQYSPKVIGVDLFFAEPNPEQASGDLELIEYARSNSRTVFVCIDSGKIVKQSFFLPDQYSNVGLANFGNIGGSSPVRSVLNKSELSYASNINSFAFQLVKNYDSSLPFHSKWGNKKEIEFGFLPFRFPGDFSASQIMNDSVNQLMSQFKNNIILIGSNEEPADMHRIPNTNMEKSDEIFVDVSGLKIQALATAILLNNEGKSKMNWFWNLFFLSIVFLSSFFLLYYLFEKWEYYFKITGRFFILTASVSLFLLYVYFMKYGIDSELGYSVFMVIFIYEMLEIYHPLMKLIQNAKGVIIAKKKFKKPEK